MWEREGWYLFDIIIFLVNSEENTRAMYMLVLIRHLEKSLLVRLIAWNFYIDK